MFSQWTIMIWAFCNVVEYEINTGNSAPIYLPPYRIPYAQRERMNKIIEEMLEHNIIEHSQ